MVLKKKSLFFNGLCIFHDPFFCVDTLSLRCVNKGLSVSDKIQVSDFLSLRRHQIVVSRNYITPVSVMQLFPSALAAGYAYFRLIFNFKSIFIR